MIPPALIQIHIVDQGRKVIGLWLPLFILWPIFLVLAVVAMPLVLIAQVVLSCLRIPIRLFAILFTVMAVISSTRGLKVDVGKKSNEETSVRINIL
jgi:hypothetical protein